MRIKEKTDSYGMKYIIYNDRRIYNLTQHKINILRDGLKITIPPSGTVLRTGYNVKLETYVGDIPIFKRELNDEVNSLPEGHYNEDYIYIVSNKILSVTDKDNFLAPFSLIRDRKNRVLGCSCLTSGIVREWKIENIGWKIKSENNLKNFYDFYDLLVLL